MVRELAEWAWAEGPQMTGEGGLLAEVGPVEIEVPRDREGSFEPQLVKKRQRRLTGIDAMVISLSAKGLTHGEISAHLAEVSKQAISTITDRVLAGAESTAMARAPSTGCVSAWAA